MRANQAAIQRRVNTPRVQTQQPPSYGNNTNLQQQTQQSMTNAYTPYPQPQPSSNNASYGQAQPPVAQTPTSGKMPPGLNPQQQLQFILNVLGERIAKLELNVTNLSNSNTDGSSASNPLSNPAFLINAIANHPDVKTLKESITRLQSIPQPPQNASETVSPDVIAEIQNNIDTLFEQVENNDAFAKFQEELQTRTELLATEINQVKDMVLQLQSTIINNLLPALVSSSNPPVPVSTLESFTEAPLDIIQQESSSSVKDMEENLGNAILPTISEPLTYQQLEL
jgi:hypothetical protein